MWRRLATHCAGNRALNRDGDAASDDAGDDDDVPGARCAAARVQGASSRRDMVLARRRLRLRIRMRGRHSSARRRDARRRRVASTRRRVSRASRAATEGVIATPRCATATAVVATED